MIGLPPLLPGVKATEADPAPTVTDVMVGAPGSAAGVPFMELEAAPVPMLLVASISTE